MEGFYEEEILNAREKSCGKAPFALTSGVASTPEGSKDRSAPPSWHSQEEKEKKKGSV